MKPLLFFKKKMFGGHQSFMLLFHISDDICLTYIPCWRYVMDFSFSPADLLVASMAANLFTHLLFQALARLTGALTDWAIEAWQHKLCGSSNPSTIDYLSPEYHAYLLVSRLILVILYQVTPGTPAHGRVEPGDAILAIEGYDSTRMNHSQASQLIKNSGQVLHLTVAK